MVSPTPPPRILESLTGGLTVPPLTRLGAVIATIGLLADLLEHTVVTHAHDAVVAGFPLEEQAAHLVVVLGMVLVLAGIVADGVRTTRRLARQEGNPRDAVR